MRSAIPPRRPNRSPATEVDTSGVIPPTGTAQSVPNPTERGSVIAVWGPTGAPGRTTVAVGVADELARLGRSTLLIDADVYGGVIAPTLGLLDESPGLAAACRSAGASRLDAAGLGRIGLAVGSAPARSDRNPAG